MLNSRGLLNEINVGSLVEAKPINSTFHRNPEPKDNCPQCYVFTNTSSNKKHTSRFVQRIHRNKCLEVNKYRVNVFRVK